MRIASLLAFLTLLSSPSLASAEQAPPFNPDEATRAWIATMGPEALQRSNSYFEGGYWIPLVGAAVFIFACALLLALGWSRGVRAWLEKTVKFKFLVALGSTLFFLVSTGVVSIPFDYWVSFVREHAYGLSTQTFGQWASEYAIAFAINLILFGLLIAVLYLVIRVAKSSWWIWGAVATTVMLAVVLVVTPVYIAPLFNKFTPMAEGAQKENILRMAQANGVPADNVHVFDTSRQSHRVTANVSGLLNTTRISLGDNLLRRSSPSAVRMVTGHEIGHYVLGHSWSLLLMYGVLFAVLFALVNLSFRALSKNERWGVRGIDDPAGLPLAAALFVVFFTIAAPISNNITRFHEHQADIFGLNASREPDGFAESALLLSEYRKMEPSPLEEWFFYDHPSGYTRIRMAMQWKAHEIAAGRLAASPGGPPPGWRPDFVVMGDEN